MSRILQMIKQGYTSLVNSDSDDYPKAQATSNQKVSDFVRMSVYGICSNPPSNSHILLLSSNGDESNKFGFQNDFLARKKDLKEGEVALYNTLTESFVVMNENGDVDVEAPNVNIVGNLTVDGDITTTGDMTATGEVTAGAVTLTGHGHPYTWTDSGGDGTTDPGVG